MQCVARSAAGHRCENEASTGKSYCPQHSEFLDDQDRRFDDLFFAVDDLEKSKGAKKKDFWDKASSLGTIFAGVVVGLVGIAATATYNSRELAAQVEQQDQNLKIRRIGVVEKFFPHLIAGETEKRGALLAIAGLGDEQLATDLAKHFGGVASRDVLIQLTFSSNPEVARQATIALNAIAFEEATSSAIREHKERLITLARDQAEAQAEYLSENRVDLRMSSGCAHLLLPESDVANCTLVRADGEPLERPITGENILALGEALEDYASSLRLLAINASKDTGEFSRSLYRTTISLRLLEETNKGWGEEGSSAVEAIVAETGSLESLEARVSTLREIIVAADPSVQEATRLLSFSAEMLSVSVRLGAFKELNLAQNRSAQAISTGASAVEITKNHDALFSKLEEFKRDAIAVRSFVRLFSSISKTHAKLSELSQAGASLDVLSTAIFESSGN